MAKFVHNLVNQGSEGNITLSHDSYNRVIIVL